MLKKKVVRLVLFSLVDKVIYISIKTQVRRLKYLSVALTCLNRKGLPKSILENRLVNWSNDNHAFFKNYVYSTGEINRKSKTSQSQSFTNYYEALLKFKLVNEQTGYVTPSKIGLVLISLQKTIMDSGSSNAYQLDDIERLFHFKNILTVDYDYFITTLELVFYNPNQAISFYIDSFQNAYIERLEKKIKTGASHNIKNQIVDILYRVKMWRSPKRYCEDIVPPRINWMADLGLLVPGENQYQLNNIGIELVKNINALEKDTLSNTWLDTSFAKVFSDAFKNISAIFWHNQTEEFKEDLMKESVELCLSFFKGLGLARLSVEQAFLFIQAFLFNKRGVIVEIDEIGEWIGYEKLIGNKKIGYRRAARSYESYLAISNV